jgi:hypothetical protein
VANLTCVISRIQQRIKLSPMSQLLQGLLMAWQLHLLQLHVHMSCTCHWFCISKHGCLPRAAASSV